MHRFYKKEKGNIMRYPKNATYRFFVQKDDKQVCVDELTLEERKKAGVWAYQTMIKALGYTEKRNPNNNL